MVSDFIFKKVIRYLIRSLIPPVYKFLTIFVKLLLAYYGKLTNPVLSLLLVMYHGAEKSNVTMALSKNFVMKRKF